MSTSDSTKPRVLRGEAPPIKLRKSNYRKVAFPSLRRDFEDRCAYSMQHMNLCGGETCLEVEHFNPTKREQIRYRYDNLFPVSRYCNSAKSNSWPTRGQREKYGFRFLNPCKEQDYGKHLFEDPETHFLISTTSAGFYHIEKCDLNAPHLVNERRLRSDLHTAFESPWPYISNKDAAGKLGLAIKEQLDLMIPQIPSLP